VCACCKMRGKSARAMHELQGCVIWIT
jgi:hypothetical protein